MMTQLTKGSVAYILMVFTLLACGKRGVEPADADDLVRKMTEASGGDSAIAAIQTHIAKYKTDGKEENSTSTVTFKRPNKIRIDVFDLKNSLVFSIATNGIEAWEYMPQLGVTATHEMKTMEMISLAEHWIDEWRLYKDIGLEIKHVDDVSLSDNRECHKMQITDRFGIESFYYVNSETFLTSRIDYPVVDAATGNLDGFSTHDFKSYGDIGVLFPIKESQDDNKIVQLMKFVNNTELNDSIFELDKIDIPVSTRYLQEIADKGIPVKELQPSARR